MPTLRKKGHRRIALTLLCSTVLLAPSTAGADPVTVTFVTFPALGDPVNTGPAMGWFTFDSRLIPSGVGQLQSTTGLGASNVRFSWGSSTWTTANADLGELRFDASGRLEFWVLFGRPFGWGSLIGPAGQVVDDFFLTPRAFSYTNAGVAGQLRGSVLSELTPTPVPEPSTMLLVAAGGAVLARRRLKTR
jgi:hypothetical protein